MTDHERYYYNLGLSGRAPNATEFHEIMGYKSEAPHQPGAYLAGCKVTGNVAHDAFRRGRAEFERQNPDVGRIFG